MKNCLPCTQGYVCLGQTTSAKPLSPVSDGGYICPAGYYCPQGTITPVACPIGSYGSTTGNYLSTQCLSCPVGTYGDEIALTACKKCGPTSTTEAGAESCNCIGLNRMYLRDTLSCICQPGYTPTDGSSSNSDGTADCQQVIYPRCTNGQVQDQFGNCKDPNDCASQCNGGNGTIQTGLGVCQCTNA